MIEEKDLTPEQNAGLDAEAERRGGMSIRSNEAIRKDLVKALLEHLNKGNGK